MDKTAIDRQQVGNLTREESLVLGAALLKENAGNYSGYWCDPRRNLPTSGLCVLCQGAIKDQSLLVFEVLRQIQ